MQGPENLLRKASVEKLSSPEQLDMMMRVTSPMGWVALVAIGVLVVAGIIWSMVFDLSVKVDGKGILVRGENVRAVQLANGGTVASLDVLLGATVSEGQVVAHLSLPDIENQLVTAKAQLADLETQSKATGSNMAEIESGLRQELGRLQGQRRQKEVLVKKGLLTTQTLVQLDQQITGIQTQLLQSRIGGGDRGSMVQNKRLEVTALQSRIENDTIVRSAYSGRVVAVLASQGQQVRAGDRLYTLEASHEPFRFVGFIPLAEGKKVSSGLEARISPSNVRPEEFGFILGKVHSISDFAATPEQIRGALSNDQLASEFSQKSSFMVVVEPDADSTPSGFKWTSSQGPPLQITSGTPCSISVVVEKRKPISYVIPTVKKALGF